MTTFHLVFTTYGEPEVTTFQTEELRDYAARELFTSEDFDSDSDTLCALNIKNGVPEMFGFSQEFLEGDDE